MAVAAVIRAHGMIEVRADDVVQEVGSPMRHAGRHRSTMPPEPAGGSSFSASDVEARLLGQRRRMHRRDLSARASVSVLSARRFWHALGLPGLGDKDPVFTDADLFALQSVAALVRGGVLDEPAALAMTRAFAQTTHYLAARQTQLIGEAMGRGVPDPATARAVALKMADVADELEPLLVYAWRRHLSAAILHMLSEAGIRDTMGADVGDAHHVGDPDDVGESKDQGDLDP